MRVSRSDLVDDPNPAPAQCYGKDAFSSPQKAHAILLARKNMRGRADVYRCTICGMYHFGRAR